MVERVAELYRVLQDKQILWLVVYVAAMGLLMEQVYWVVVVFIMMAARVLPRGQLNLGVVFVATRVLLVEQILGEVVCMAAMALHVGQANGVVSYMLTRVLFGKFGAKKDKRLVVVDNMKEVVEYKIIFEENQGSEGKSLKADVLERSSLSFPSLNFSWGM